MCERAAGTLTAKARAARKTKVTSQRASSVRTRRWPKLPCKASGGMAASLPAARRANDTVFAICRARLPGLRGEPALIL